MVLGGPGWKCIEGPVGIEEENREDRSGRMNRMRSGKRFDRAPIVLCGRSSALPLASLGLLLGRPPPN